MTTLRCSQSRAGRRPVLDALKVYEDAVAARDNAAATSVVDEMLTAGAQPVTVLTDVIAAAQRAVGARWQRGEWTVAQEHAATAMAVDATKTVMSTSSGRRSHADGSSWRARSGNGTHYPQ